MHEESMHEEGCWVEHAWRGNNYAETRTQPNTLVACLSLGVATLGCKANHNFKSWSLDEANPTVQRWQIRALLAVATFHQILPHVESRRLHGWTSFMTNFAITKLRQSVSATKNVANKMATTSVARFGKKLSLWHVDHVARKVWQATSVAMNQTHAWCVW